MFIAGEIKIHTFPPTEVLIGMAIFDFGWCYKQIVDVDNGLTKFNINLCACSQDTPATVVRDSLVIFRQLFNILREQNLHQRCIL